MFIRPCYQSKNGKRHAYWALVESYRTARGPRQRTVAYLGMLKESERFNAIPHFAGLSLASAHGSEMPVDDLVKGGDCTVIFNGITVVR